MFIHIVRSLPVLVAGIVLASCSGIAESAPDQSAEAHLRAAIERTRRTSATLDLAARVSVDGEVAAELRTTGRIVDGGDSFDVEMRTSEDANSTVEVRLVGGVLLQRGPVVAQLFPEAGGRWVDLGADLSAGLDLGLIGPRGFAVLDLLDDLGAVNSTSSEAMRGTLTDVRIDGGRIAGLDAADFEARVVDGLVTMLDISIRSADGTELTVSLRLADIGVADPITAPAAEDVHVP